MNLAKMSEQIKSNPDFSKAGMVLFHNGVVRENSREGDAVTGLTIKVNHEILNEIIAQAKARPGIVEVLVHINENQALKVGDDVMFLAVAGDIRENVLETLTLTLNRIKAEATSKTQDFVG